MVLRIRSYKENHKRILTLDKENNTQNFYILKNIS